MKTAAFLCRFRAKRLLLIACIICSLASPKSRRILKSANMNRLHCRARVMQIRIYTFISLTCECAFILPRRRPSCSAFLQRQAALKQIAPLHCRARNMRMRVYIFISLTCECAFILPRRRRLNSARPPEAGRLYFLKINTTSASLPSVASAESPSPSDSYLPTPSLSANLYPAALNSTSMESAKD